MVSKSIELDDRLRNALTDENASREDVEAAVNLIADALAGELESHIAGNPESPAGEVGISVDGLIDIKLDIRER